LKRGKRVFAVVILVAKRMLDAGENPGDRGKYSLELLNGLDESDILALS
jgi:hypothetical protein